LFLRQQCGNALGMTPPAFVTLRSTDAASCAPTNGLRRRRRKQKVKVRKYRDKNRPHLRFVVNWREEGKRKRQFFATKEEANTVAEQINTERENKGREGAEFPSALREMARECADMLSKFQRTIRDATDFYLQHLVASQKSCAAVELVQQLVIAKKKDGASQRHLDDIRSRLSIFAQQFDGQPVATIATADIDDATITGACSCWRSTSPCIAVTRPRIPQKTPPEQKRRGSRRSFSPSVRPRDSLSPPTCCCHTLLSVYLPVCGAQRLNDWIGAKSILTATQSKFRQNRRHRTGEHRCSRICAHGCCR